MYNPNDALQNYLFPGLQLVFETLNLINQPIKLIVPKAVKTKIRKSYHKTSIINNPPLPSIVPVHMLPRDLNG